MVAHDGTVFWPPIVKFRSTCLMDVTYFPFDDQVCKMKTGSWAYDGYQVDIKILNRSNSIDLSRFVENGEWELVSATAVRNVVYYPCCLEPFPDVTFNLHIRRRTTYYMYNVIIPSVMLSSLALLGFWMHPDSGEKVTLGLTVLLALSVFMLLIAENTPATSFYVPLLGKSLWLFRFIQTAILTCIWGNEFKVDFLFTHKLYHLCIHRFSFFFRYATIVHFCLSYFLSLDVIIIASHRRNIDLKYSNDVLSFVTTFCTSINMTSSEFWYIFGMSFLFVIINIDSIFRCLSHHGHVLHLTVRDFCCYCLQFSRPRNNAWNFAQGPSIICHNIVKSNVYENSSFNYRTISCW